MAPLSPFPFPSYVGSSAENILQDFKLCSCKQLVDTLWGIKLQKKRWSLRHVHEAIKLMKPWHLSQMMILTTCFPSGDFPLDVDLRCRALGSMRNIPIEDVDQAKQPRIEGYQWLCQLAKGIKSDIYYTQKHVTYISLHDPIRSMFVEVLCLEDKEKMLTLIFVILLLKVPLVLCTLTNKRCLWRIRHNAVYDGESQTDCVFVVYVRKLMGKDMSYESKSHLPPEQYAFGLALDYALDEINKNPSLLPNMSLGFYLFTELCNLDKIKHSISQIVNGLNFPNYKCYEEVCHVAISGETWTKTAEFAPFFQISNMPQLYYGPFHPILSDHDNFPNLCQMATKNTFLSLAMVSLMVYFNWIWVGLFISDDDQGVQFLSDLRAEMQRNGICPAFVNVVAANQQLYMTRTVIYYKQNMASTANVIIIYGDMNSILGETIRTRPYLGTQKIWVTTTQWDAITSKRGLNTDPFHRTFTLAHQKRDVYGFKNFIQTLKSSKYLEDISPLKLGWLYFNCSASEPEWKTLHNSSPNASWELFTRHTFDLAMSEESYNLYNAAYAVSHAFHELLLQQVDIEMMKSDDSLQSDCGKLQHLLKTIQFTNPVGDLVNMNQKRKSDTVYDIFHLGCRQQNLQLKVKIGQFSPYFPQVQQLQLSEDMLAWAIGGRQIPSSVCSVSCSPGFRKSHQEGKAACCFDCIPCPENEISNETGMEQCLKCLEDQFANREQTHCLQRAVTFLAFEDPLGMALACMALCFSLLTVLVLGVFVKHHDTPVVRANNRALSYILLISLIFCFLCSLLFIGHPNTATCILQQTTFGVVFTVAVSTILAKTVTVVLAFKLTTPKKRMRWLLVSGAPNFIIPICILIQLILCGVWLGTSPPFLEKDSHSEHGHIIIVCNTGSVRAFYCVLGYLGSLALGSFTVAFFARNLPSTYNEAKFLTFSMLVFCSVWITFLPVYHSTKGKVMVAVEVFSILSSSAGLLGCIFVPKCYIIILRPDRNFLPKYRDRTLS